MGFTAPEETDSRGYRSPNSVEVPLWYLIDKTVSYFQILKPLFTSEIPPVLWFIISCYWINVYFVQCFLRNIFSSISSVLTLLNSMQSTSQEICTIFALCDILLWIGNGNFHPYTSALYFNGIHQSYISMAQYKTALSPAYSRFLTHQNKAHPNYKPYMIGHTILQMEQLRQR